MMLVGQLEDRDLVRDQHLLRPRLTGDLAQPLPERLAAAMLSKSTSTSTRLG